MNCLLKHVIEAKIKRSIKVTGRKGSRRKQLLDDPKETILFCCGPEVFVMKILAPVVPGCVSWE
jgi:hypothetical protein